MLMNLFVLVIDRNGSERPEPHRQAAIDEHRTRHPLDYLVGSLCNSILLGRVRDGSFVGESVCLAVSLEFAVNEFRRIVDT